MGCEISNYGGAQRSFQNKGGWERKVTGAGSKENKTSPKKDNETWGVRSVKQEVAQRRKHSRPHRKWRCGDWK